MNDKTFVDTNVLVYAHDLDAGEKHFEQFGKPLSAFQATQFKLADMKTNIDAARLLTFRAAAMKDKGLPNVREAAADIKYLPRQKNTWVVFGAGNAPSA
mgnify:CR=1 FL=1